MDIRLTHGPHPHRPIRAAGVGPANPYVEWCWGPVIGPSAIVLLRRVADLTRDGDALMPFPELSRMLGLGGSETPTRNNKLVRTCTRLEQYGLAFVRVGEPDDPVTFGIYDQVALVPHRLLHRLPEISQQYHAAAVTQVNEALAEHGLPALRSPVPPVPQSPGPASADGVSPTPGDVVEPAPRATHAVAPTARLDAIANDTHVPLEQSL